MAKRNKPKPNKNGSSFTTIPPEDMPDVESVLRILKEGGPDKENFIRSLFPSEEAPDDEINRQMYESAKLLVEMGYATEKPEDDFGAARYFITTFITDEMRRSFPTIAEQFLRNEPLIRDISLAEAVDSRYFRDGRFRSYVSPQDAKKDYRDAYNQKILNLMFDCMQMGSQYSRNLILALYKTYYKREYNVLKRYHTVNEYDLLTLSDEALREELGQDARLHATIASKTVGEVLMEGFEKTPGNMNCFEKATWNGREDYIRVARKGGMAKVGDHLIDVDALFGTWDDVEDQDFINPHTEGENNLIGYNMREYAQQPYEPSVNPSVSRIYVMCEIMGIEFDRTCYTHLLDMNASMEKQEGMISKMQDGLGELIRDSSSRAADWARAEYPGSADPAKYQKDISYLPLQLSQDIIHQMFTKYDVSKEILYGDTPLDLPMEIGKVIFMMESVYPGYKIGRGYTLILAMLGYVSEAMARLYKAHESELSDLLHIEEEHYIGRDSTRVGENQPDGKAVRVIKTVEGGRREEEPKPAKQEVETSPGVDAEIDRLNQIIREKDEEISQKEQDVIYQRSLYEEAHAKEAEYEAMKADYEAMRKELAALREHVFSMTEDDVELPEGRLEEMEAAIADKKVLIIGGHENWQRRLRTHFPKWRFIAVSDNAPVDAVEGMDYIYFFTDTMNHSMYYKYIGIMRQRQKNYYYIHETNIEKNIRQIYGDIVKVG